METIHSFPWWNALWCAGLGKKAGRNIFHNHDGAKKQQWIWNAHHPHGITESFLENIYGFKDQEKLTWLTTIVCSLVWAVLAVRFPITVPSLRNTLAGATNKIQFCTSLLYCNTNRIKIISINLKRLWMSPFLIPLSAKVKSTAHFKIRRETKTSPKQGMFYTRGWHQTLRGPKPPHLSDQMPNHSIDFTMCVP